MGQPVQNDGNGGVRLFENSDVEIIDIVRNDCPLSSILRKIVPLKKEQPNQTSNEEKISSF